MRRVLGVGNIYFATFLLMAATGLAAEPPLPRIGGRKPSPRSTAIRFRWRS